LVLSFRFWGLEYRAMGFGVLSFSLFSFRSKALDDIDRALGLWLMIEDVGLKGSSSGFRVYTYQVWG